MRKTMIRLVLLVLLSSALLPGMAVAQDDEALAFVQDALSGLAEQSYHFALKSSTISTVTQQDESPLTTYSTFQIEGDAQGADSHVVIQTQSSDSFAAMREADPFSVEMVVKAGEIYVNLQTAGTVFEGLLGSMPGWWRYDDLLASADTPGEQIVFQQLRTTAPIWEQFAREGVISGVTELEPEVVDGVEMRVFDLEFDVIELLLAQTPILEGSIEQPREEIIAEAEAILAEGEATVNYRLWIGADDGLLYRGSGEQHTFLPYMTAEFEGGPGVDLETEYSAEFAISQHGQPVTIEPPDESLLNSVE